MGHAATRFSLCHTSPEGHGTIPSRVATAVKLLWHVAAVVIVDVHAASSLYNLHYSQFMKLYIPFWYPHNRRTITIFVALLALSLFSVSDTVEDLLQREKHHAVVTENIGASNSIMDVDIANDESLHMQSTDDILAYIQTNTADNENCDVFWYAASYIVLYVLYCSWLTCISLFHSFVSETDF